jgi:hypothetical protein
LRLVVHIASRIQSVLHNSPCAVLNECRNYRQFPVIAHSPGGKSHVGSVSPVCATVLIDGHIRLILTILARSRIDSGN